MTENDGAMKGIHSPLFDPHLDEGGQSKAIRYACNPGACRVHKPPQHAAAVRRHALPMHVHAQEYVHLAHLVACTNFLQLGFVSKPDALRRPTPGLGVGRNRSRPDPGRAGGVGRVSRAEGVSNPAARRSPGVGQLTASGLDTNPKTAMNRTAAACTHHHQGDP